MIIEDVDFDHGNYKVRGTDKSVNIAQVAFAAADFASAFESD